MAGHSKWHNIKHKKAAADAKRGKVFTRFSKLISVAVKEAGGDVDHPNVQTIIEKAKKNSVPKDNIERAISKGRDTSSAALEAVVYEGYGPGGVGFIVEAITDNRNRTGQEVKHIFSKAGYSMGVPGSVSWAFIKNEEGDWEAQADMQIATSEDIQKAVDEFIELLEEQDDVTRVVTNAT
ncbi:MAG: YebC/PmpR family DNA-binding transcriptional regulator [Patescibacteria group bacterium]